MREIYKTLAAGMLVVGGFFAAFPVYAQSDPLIVGQGRLDVPVTLPDTQFIEFTIAIGNGWVATSTGAFLGGVYNASSGTQAAGQEGQIIILGFSDSSYTTGVSTCAYNTIGSPHVQTNGTLQLNGKVEGAPGDCAFKSDLYYRITIDYSNTGTGHPYWSTVYGTNSNLHPTWVVNYASTTPNVLLPQPFALPYFSIVGNGFQIIPTTADSGVFFSGAVEFCNNAFASSTSIGAVFGNALCIAGGFLFIPSAASYNQFVQLPSLLASTPPISWGKDLATIYENAQASSTPNFINLSIDFGATTTKAIGIQKLDVISTTTISKYMPENVRQSILALEGAVFLASAASAIYFTIKYLWRTT